MFKRTKTVKIEEETLRKMATFMIVICILFLSVILVYTISLVMIIKNTNIDTNINNISVNPVISENEFNSVDLTTTTLLGETCVDGCGISFILDNVNYYVRIYKDSENYVLEFNNITRRIAMTSIGEDISDLSVSKYNDLVMFKELKKTNSSSYDELIFFNGAEIDTIKSIPDTSIEVTSEGIYYYEVECKSDTWYSTSEIKYLKQPFSNTKTFIDSTSKHSSLC